MCKFVDLLFIYLFKIEVVHKSTQKYKKKKNNNKILSSKFAYPLLK